MKEFKTKVERLGFPIGTKVTYDDTRDTRDTMGKTGKLLCTVPIGGALFYDESELEEV